MTNKNPLINGFHYTTLLRAFARETGLSFEKISEVIDLAQMSYTPSGKIKTGIYRCTKDVKAFGLKKHRFYFVKARHFGKKVTVNGYEMPFQTANDFFKVFKPYFFTNKHEQLRVNKLLFFENIKEMTQNRFTAWRLFDEN